VAASHRVRGLHKVHQSSKEKSMSESEVNQFRRLLEAKREDLLSASSFRDEIAIQVSADEIDRLQQQMSREVAIRTLDNTSRLLKRIQTALELLEDDLYGVCLRCDNLISEKRLKAIPWASYCVTCQEILDGESFFDDDDVDDMSFAA
jgi:DnaK suppressor protein